MTVAFHSHIIKKVIHTIIPLTQGQENNADVDLALAHQSSEPESNSRGQTPAQVHHQDGLPRGQQHADGQNVSDPQNGDGEPLLARPSEDLYNFKGFMLFCFGAPGISPAWCSKCSKFQLDTHLLIIVKTLQAASYFSITHCCLR